MRNLTQAIGLLVLAVFSCRSAFAQSDKTADSLSASAVVGVYSDYIFRGLNLFEGASIQPSLTLEYEAGPGVISANLWSHLSGHSQGETERFFELDYTLAYALETDSAALTLGHSWYTYPGEEEIDNTAEFFGVLALDDSAINHIFTLSPTVSIYHDYELEDGQYYELSLSHSFAGAPIGQGGEITPFVAFGFANSQDSQYAKDGFVQVTYGLSLAFQIGEIFLVPSINYTQGMDDYLSNEFWFGTTLSYEL